MPPQTWYTSDLHFGHQLMADKRGFASKDAMHEALVSKWRQTIQPKDTVYVLGDFMMGHSVDYVKILALIDTLPGRKIFVAGNHDSPRKIRYFGPRFMSINGAIMKTIGHHKVLLTHYPVHPDSLSYGLVLNLHGHIHWDVVRQADGLPDVRYRNVCVDMNNLLPVPQHAIHDRLHLLGGKAS